MSSLGDVSGTEKTIVHASCVALNNQGLLILGASGHGKSGLALTLMGMGAALVADDQVVLTRIGKHVVASVPLATDGLIEARGIGLLRTVPHGPVPVKYVVDLNQVETVRMPPVRQMVLLGVSLDLIFKVDVPHFPASLIQLMKQGRHPEP